MSARTTVLKEKLRRRHWQTYATFCRRYDDVARVVDETLVGHWPSRGQFARWLGGDVKGLPHPDHCRILESMFDGISVDELFAPATPPTDATAPPPIDPPRAAERADGALMTRTPLEVSVTGAVTAYTTSDQRWFDTTRAVATRPLHEEIALATQESAQFVRRARGAVDQDTLDQLEDDVRQLATDFLTGPPLVLFRPLSLLRHEVFEMLDLHQSPALLPQLYGIAGKLCALLAHASSDLGHGYAAGSHTRTAWLCADLAGDDQLRSYVRWVQSNVAYWSGDYRRAAQIAQAGRRHATAGSSLLRLASQEARAWAACHERDEVERSLAVAQTARDRDERDDSPGVFRFDRGKAAYYASEVRLSMGGKANARLAEAEAHEALRLFDDDTPDRRCPEFVAAARLDLANAQLALADLDGAAEQLRVVLRLPVEKRTQPIVSRVGAAGTALAAGRFTRSALALDLREEIDLFSTYTANRELPEVLD